MLSKERWLYVQVPRDFALLRLTFLSFFAWPVCDLRTFLVARTAFPIVSIRQTRIKFEQLDFTPTGRHLMPPPPVTPKKKKPPPAAVPRKKAAVAPPVTAKKKAVAPPPPKKKEAVPPPAKRKVVAPPPTEKEEPATTTEPETVPAAVEAVSAAAEATPTPIASSSTTRETESASVEGSEKPENADKVPAPPVHQDTVTTVPEAAPSTSAAVANAPVAVKDDAADEQAGAATTEEKDGNLSDGGDTPSAPPIPGDGKDAAPDDPPATPEATASAAEASPGEDIPDGSKVDETETQQAAEQVEQPAKEKKTPVVIPACVQCEHEGHITKSKWWIPELSEFLCADVSSTVLFSAWVWSRPKNNKNSKTGVDLSRTIALRRADTRLVRRSPFISAFCFLVFRRCRCPCLCESLPNCR